MVLLSNWSGTYRYFINIDYFIPLLFLSFKRRILFLVSFILLILFDFINIFSQIFPIIRITDLIYLLGFIFQASSLYKLYAILLIIIVTAECWFVHKFYNKNYNMILMMIFNIILLIQVVDVYVLKRIHSLKYSYSISTLASGTISFWNYRNDGFLQTFRKKGEAFQNGAVNGATKEIFEQVDLPNKVLLIVNESWGVPLDNSIKDDVLSPIYNSIDTSSIKVDDFSFTGFTLHGELRELCRNSPAHFNLRNQITGFEACLPHKFNKLGYSTIAVHGALGLMYDRIYWYPRAGFQKMLFRDHGMNLMKSRCYSYPGNCDADIKIKIAEEFKKSNKIFLYWLTLNTHASYDKRDLKIDKFDCQKYNIESTTESCRNLKLQKQFFIILADMITGPEFKDTKVIVVGDHEPPIINKEKNIFVSERVPVISFNVK